MSYKVEVTEDEHFPVLLETIADWSTQEHDVHLVTEEGLRVFSHKKLLSLYSNVIKEILNDPVIAFSPQIPTISVPVSANDVLLLFKVLEAGLAKTNHKDDLVHIRNTASVLGIEIKNLYLNENKKSYDFKSQGKSIIRLPASKVKDQVAKDANLFDDKKVNGKGKSFPDIPKSIEIFPKSASIPKPVPVQKITNGNTSVISKSSDLRIELKEVIDEETSNPNHEEMASELPSTSTAVVKADLDDCVCNICGKLFENIRKVNRHKHKVHGKKSMKKKDNEEPDRDLNKSTDSKKESGGKDKVISSTEALVIKKESVQPPPQPLKPKRTIAPCELCPKVFNTEENLEKHKSQKHTKLETPREAHKCDFCEKYFNNAANLQIHKRCHRDEMDSMKKCQICGSQFFNQEKLISHMKDHEKEESQNMGKYSVEVTKAKYPDNPKTYGIQKSKMKGESYDKSPLPLEMNVESLNADIQSVVRDMNVDNTDDIAIEEEFSNIFDNAKKEMNISSSSNIQIETVESLASATQNTCGYCGDNFKDEDALNQHIAFMHC